MKSLSSTSKFIAAAALAAAAFGTVTAAHARSDVVLSIGLQGAPLYSQPVYAQTDRYYVQPQPVYVQPRPVFTQPAPVYEVQPRFFIRHGVEYVYVDGRTWRTAEWRRHYFRQHHRDWDRDQHASRGGRHWD